jgi:Domain of unknown function (DUF2341)
MQRALWILSLLVCVASCSSKQNDTKIVVEVWSDLAVPSQMDEIRIVAKGTTPSQPADFLLTGEANLPVVLVLVPPDNQDLPFDVTATGYLKSNPVVSQSAHLSFVTGKSLVLTLFLDSACKDVPCPTNQTCSSGSCKNVDVDVSGLPAYDPNARLLPPDAGAGVIFDGGPDVGAASAGGAEVGGVDARADGAGDSAADKPLDMPVSGPDSGTDVAHGNANAGETSGSGETDGAAGDVGEGDGGGGAGDVGASNGGGDSAGPSYAPDAADSRGGWAETGGGGGIGGTSGSGGSDALSATGGVAGGDGPTATDGESIADGSIATGGSDARDAPATGGTDAGGSEADAGTDVSFDARRETGGMGDGGEQKWWNSSWRYSVPCYINTTAPSALIDFPAHCIVDTQSLISATKMGSLCQDLRVVNGSQDTALDYEIENGTCNTAKTVVWIRVPSTSAAGVDTIFLFYGNPTAGDAQNVVGVWRNGYTSVWHGGGSYVDSLGTNNMTSMGSMSISSDSARCRYGSCFSYDAADAYLQQPSAVQPTGNMTVTAWVWSSASGSGAHIFDIGTASFNNQDNLLYGTGQFLFAKYQRVGSGFGNVGPSIPLTFVGYVVTGSNNVTAFVNSTTYSLTPIGGTAITSGVINIGGYYYNWGKYGIGTIDEVRLANIARSIDWINAEYAQSDSIGSELLGPSSNFDGGAGPDASPSD